MKELQDTIEGTIEDDVLIERNALLEGMIAGNVTTRGGARFEVSGRITKDISVGKGCIVQIYGVADGNIYVEGGQLEVWGTVNGSIYRKAGEITIYGEATINGKITGSQQA
jgi:cytoskeletal protein CcmA (bactofilin family)